MPYKINLLPPNEHNIADKMVYFAFHYLRYILVITQLVVIIVFFYRFKVDQDIIDLKDSLKQKQEVIHAVEPLLNEVAKINGKIANAKSVITKQDQFNEIYTYFVTKAPDDVEFTNIHVDLQSVDCEGVTDSVTSVKMFYEDLLQEKRFSSVELLNIQKAEQGYTFALKLQGFDHQNGL